MNYADPDYNTLAIFLNCLLTVMKTELFTIAESEVDTTNSTVPGNKKSCQMIYNANFEQDFWDIFSVYKHR